MSSTASLNEAARLEAVAQYRIAREECDAKFDDLVRLASQICKTPIAAISFVDENRAWFKSKRGLEIEEISRDVAFCTYTVQGTALLVINNAQEDERFRTSPLVNSQPYVRFYAGVPLITASGQALGALCAMDWVPRALTQEQKDSLGIIARQIVLLLEERLARRDVAFSYHDSVTNLPNQELFKDRLEQALALSRRGEQVLGVMLVSLDRFKTIHDTLGYVTADQLLREVAARLTDCVRDSDTVARFGNDEFAVLLTQLNRAEDAAKIAQNIAEALSPAFKFDSQELFVTTSIGISLFPTDANDTVALLRNAGTALNRAQEKDGHNYEFYTSGRTTKALRQLVLENNMHSALERGEFVLYYQPQVDLQTLQIVGMEALIRWRHPGLGLLLPGDFISVAEDCGLIVAIGDWALREACMQSKAWQDAGFEALRLAVNLSARQFQQPRLVESVAEVLEESGLEPRFLELELTEGSVMKDPELAIGKLHELKAMGIKISIDDFGTGYSSLSYLRRFPIDTLKIDQSFVREISTNPDDAAIVAAIITLAHTLKLSVIAEGVETKSQLDHLRRLECDDVQGFLFCKPLSVEEFTRRLMERLSLTAREKYDTSPLPNLASGGHGDTAHGQR